MHTNAPKLFRARKGKKEILILGTDHSFSLDIFTEDIKKIILSPQKLLMERLNFTVPEMTKDLLTIDKDLILRGNEESKFSLLSDYDKTFVKNILKSVTDEFLKENIEFSEIKDAIIFGMLYGLLQVVNANKEYDGVNSMDVEIRELFKAQEKEVIGLEKTQDIMPSILYFYKVLPSDYIVNPSFFFSMMINHISRPESHAAYLYGHVIKERDEPDVVERNEKWFASIKHEIKKTNSVLIAVGVSHLTDRKSGLLRWFNSLGYSIEIIDAYGQFKPFELPGFKPCLPLSSCDLFFEKVSSKEKSHKESENSNEVVKKL